MRRPSHLTSCARSTRPNCSAPSPPPNPATLAHPTRAAMRCCATSSCCHRRRDQQAASLAERLEPERRGRPRLLRARARRRRMPAARPLGIPYGFSVHARDARKVSRTGGASQLTRRVSSPATRMWPRRLCPMGVATEVVPHGVDVTGSALAPPLAARCCGSSPSDVSSKRRALSRSSPPLRTSRAVRFAHHRRRPRTRAAAGSDRCTRLGDRVALPGSPSHTASCPPTTPLPMSWSSHQSSTASGDRDGLPNVVLEAMASARAVIASDVAAIPSAVRHGTTGMLVPSDDAAALARALDLLAIRPCPRARLAHSGRRHVEPPSTSIPAPAASSTPCRPPMPDGAIAYVLKGFPRRTETFVASEIFRLERSALTCDCSRSSRTRCTDTPSSTASAPAPVPPEHHLVLAPYVAAAMGETNLPTFNRRCGASRAVDRLGSPVPSKPRSRSRSARDATSGRAPAACTSRSFSCRQSHSPIASSTRPTCATCTRTSRTAQRPWPGWQRRSPTCHSRSPPTRPTFIASRSTLQVCFTAS